jgi:quinol monooxygenase YgiN
MTQTTEVFIFARFHARPGGQAALRLAIRDVQGPTLEEDGCLGYGAFQSVRDPDEFFVHSHWRDQAAFDKHAALPHTLRFVAAVEGLIDHPLSVSLTARLE